MEAATAIPAVEKKPLSRESAWAIWDEVVTLGVVDHVRLKYEKAIVDSDARRHHVEKGEHYFVVTIGGDVSGEAVQRVQEVALVRGRALSFVEGVLTIA